MDADYREFWRHAFDLGLKAAHALRQRLNLDEDNFRHRAPYSHKDSRCVYIYRALDEVQKAATCLIRWADFFPGGEAAEAEEDVRKQIERITEQAVLDEQAMRSRKLTEALVDTILFLTTNEDIYFKDYFYLNELFEYESSQRDRREFYGFASRNSDHHIQWLKKCVLRLEESGLEPYRRWYLRQPKSIALLEGHWLSSFRSRYKRISIEQGPEIATLLARSYSEAYGHSREVHFSAHDTSFRFSPESSMVAANRVALLMFHLILKLQELSNTVFGDDADVLVEIRGKLEATTVYSELTTPNADVGDYVLVHDDLGKVIEQRRSNYGYLSYRIRYLGRRPIPTIAEDWFAPFQIYRLGSKFELLGAVKGIISKYAGDAISDSAMASIEDTHFERALEQSVHEVLAHFRRVRRSPRRG